MNITHYTSAPACGARSNSTTESVLDVTCSRCRRTKRFKDAAPDPIAILPLGPVPEIDLGRTERLIRKNFFGTRTRRLPMIPLPPTSFAPVRNQYDADKIFELLFDRLPTDCSRIIGVIDADLYAEGRTFVFGYAHLRDGIAIYSTLRFRESWYGRKPNHRKEFARARKALVHELAHTYGQGHCENPVCVLRAVSQIDSLDMLTSSLCTACLQKVRKGIAIKAQSAEGLFLRAGAYLRRRYVPRAIQTYQEAVAKAPLEPRYVNDLGVALLAASDRKGSRAAFQRAADLAADFPHPYYNLGILEREYGDTAKAEQWLNEGLKRDPDPIAANLYVGNLYADLFCDQVRAKQHFQKHLDLGGNHPSARWFMMKDQAAVAALGQNQKEST